MINAEQIYGAQALPGMTPAAPDTTAGISMNRGDKIVSGPSVRLKPTPSVGAGQ